MFKLASKSNY